jgi:hypothetical protein
MASADAPSAASTAHQSRCPPVAHDPRGRPCRSGLEKAFHEAIAIRHSSGSWAWVRT